MYEYSFCYNEVGFPLRIVLQWTLLQVRISAGSLCGLHYALCSFTQLLRLSAAEPDGHVLVPVLIQDHPAMRHRAVFLDMSPRGTVPTLVSLV
jgi:N-acetyl-beta-hexosaminidase